MERRQNEHRRRARLSAEQACRRNAVELGHANVHEHDIRVMAVDGCKDASTVVDLPDDVDSLRSPEHHLEARPDERVVVDQKDAHDVAHGCRGSFARRTKSPLSSCPNLSSPPVSATRSASPTSPVPVPTDGTLAPAETPTVERLTTPISSDCGSAEIDTSTAAPGACLRA